MSGHSKWSTIKHKKAKEDAKKGKVFTKLIKEITIAARIGGGDIEGNPRLRSAVTAGRAANMPQDNIMKAIKKGTGELEGVHYEDSEYEGYGPGGVAILVTVTSDNKNRTVAELRHVFTKYGGNMGEAGCVSWIFDKKGLLLVDQGVAKEDEMMELALEAGAEDFRHEDKMYEIITNIDNFEKVKDVFKNKKINCSLAEITMVPKSTVKLESEQARRMLHLMEALEDHDDVQKVYANFDISAEEMEKL